MVRHIWSVLCKQTVINQETNLMSLNDLLEGFDVKVNRDAPKDAEIVLPVEYEIVSLLRKENDTENEKVDLRASFFDPNGKELLDKKIIKIEIPKDHYNYRQRIKNFGFKITTPGVYRFIVEIKQEGEKEFKQVAELPVNISISKK